MKGSNILTTLINLSSCNNVYTISRRPPPQSPNGKKNEEDNDKINSVKLNSTVSGDLTEWPTLLSHISPTPEILFSSLGTSRARAGSIEAQRKIDYDLNLSVATSARTAGVKVYVLVSSIGANASSPFPYLQMKGQLEEAVKKLGFDSLVILRPGLLLGDREEGRMFEWAARTFTGGLRYITGNFVTDHFAQDATIVAQAAVSAGLRALESEPGTVSILGQPDIVKLGRTEWKP